MPRKKVAKVVRKLVHGYEVHGDKQVILCGKAHAGDLLLDVGTRAGRLNVMLVDDNRGLCERCADILNAFARGWNAAISAAAINSAVPDTFREQNAPGSGSLH